MNYMFAMFNNGEQSSWPVLFLNCKTDINNLPIEIGLIWEDIKIRLSTMNKTVYMNNGSFGLRTTTIGADRSECDILMSLTNSSGDLIFSQQQPNLVMLLDV